jgi:hypothetical protein
MNSPRRRANIQKTPVGDQLLARWAADALDTPSRVGRLKPGQEDVSRGPLFTDAAARRDEARQRTIDEE